MSFDKVVKLACKPKAAAPKAKYLDPIIAATYTEDGALSDVCRALGTRLREPNATVVFKALLVLHTMIRTGNTENVLSFLSHSDTMRLQNVASGHWEGYSAPENLGQYANYLQIRIKTFRDLKHDPVRVQTESNRDHRVSIVEDDRDRRDFGGRGDEFGGRSGGGVSRSKTVMGRKLRVMSVEKGLLRETRIVQGVIDALLSTKFYLDNLEEELNVLALRMLVKDLLVLFQAVNEGIINLLEHYFEMSHVDASEALASYRRFCRQTEGVVEYLSIARKLQNLLNVSIPNLKHAPVSLVNSLEEYLNDPNFEDNRLEYKAAKAAADGKPTARSKSSTTPASPPASTSTAPPAKPAVSPIPQNVADFFSSIESEQSNMFNPNTNSPTSNYFQSQASSNPFGQQLGQQQQPSFVLPQQTGALAFQQPQVTGFPGQGGPFVQPQATGFPPPNPTSPFFQQQPQQPQPTGAFLSPQPQQSSSPFLQPQPTSGGFLQPHGTGFLQPQATGSNPFRQSMLMPQATGLPAFGGSGASSPAFGGSAAPSPVSAHNPFPRPGSASGMFSGPSRSTTLPPLQEVPTGNATGNGNGFGGAFSPAPSNGQNAFNSQTPLQPPNTTSLFGGSIQRPASTPIRSSENTSGGMGMTQVATHKTGGNHSRNPFGAPAPAPPPPVPKAPTLFELSSGGGGAFGQGSFGASGGGGAGAGGTGAGGSGTQALKVQPTGNGLIGGIASSFLSSNPTGTPTASSPPPTNAHSPFSSFLGSSGQNGPSSPISSQPTGASSAFSSAFSGASAFTPSTLGSTTTGTSFSSTSTGLQPQATGFGGSNVRPFKPSSSFGASIVDKLPTIPSEPNTPGLTGGPNGPLLGGGGNGNGTGSGLGGFSGLSLGGSSSPAPGANGTQTQPTRQTSLFGAGNGNTTTGGLGGTNGFSSPSFGTGGGLQPQATGVANPFRASMFGGGLTSTPTGTTPNFGSGSGAFSGGGGFQPSSNFGQQTGNGSASGAPTLQPSFTGFGSFGSQFGNAFGGAQGGQGQGQGQQQQQTGSLI